MFLKKYQPVSKLFFLPSPWQISCLVAYFPWNLGTGMNRLVRPAFVFWQWRSDERFTVLICSLTRHSRWNHKHRATSLCVLLSSQSRSSSPAAEFCLSNESTIVFCQGGFLCGTAFCILKTLFFPFRCISYWVK